MCHCTNDHLEQKLVRQVVRWMGVNKGRDVTGGRTCSKRGGEREQGAAAKGYNRALLTLPSSGEAMACGRVRVSIGYKFLGGKVAILATQGVTQDKPWLEAEGITKQSGHEGPGSNVGSIANYSS